MRIGISSSGRITTRTGARRSTAMLGAAVLMAMLVFLLWLRIGFARYAFTAFQWERANGSVTSAVPTTDPTIQFVAPDGSRHAFNEDYFLLCSRRSLCFRRTFTPGEIVPVIYYPADPSRAYVRDFALYSTIFEWFVEAFFLVVIGLAMSQLISGGSGNLSIRFGSRPMIE
jgi:Protein of unknown function (DUF3592)